MSWNRRINDVQDALSYVLRRSMCGCEFEDCVLEALGKHQVLIDFSNVSQLGPFGALRVLDTEVTVVAAPKPELPCFGVCNNCVPIFFDGDDVNDFLQAASTTTLTNWAVFVPMASNYPLFDFMLVKNTSVFGVQITIGREHPGKGKATAAWLDKCGPSAPFQLKGIIFMADSQSELSCWQGFATYQHGWTKTTDKGKALTAAGVQGVALFAAVAVLSQFAGLVLSLLPCVGSTIT